MDFAVGDGRVGFRAFIVVTDALFGTQEAALARRTLDLVRDAQSHPAEVVLVVAATCLPLHVGTWRGPPGGSCVRRDGARATGGAGERPEPALILAASAAPSDLEERLAAVQASLAALESERASESEALQERVADLARTQVAKRQSEELDDARRQWSAVEEGIGRELREVRQNRQIAELAALECLRASAERDRLQFVILLLVVVTVCLMVTGSAITTSGFRTYNWTPDCWFGWPGVLVGAVILTYLYRPSSRRELERPIASVQATALPRVHRVATIGGSPPRQRNPHLRYVGAILLERSRSSPSEMTLSRAVNRRTIGNRPRPLVRSMATGRSARPQS